MLLEHGIPVPIDKLAAAAIGLEEAHNKQRPRPESMGVFPRLGRGRQVEDRVLVHGSRVFPIRLRYHETSRHDDAPRLLLEGRTMCQDAGGPGNQILDLRFGLVSG